MMKGVIMAYGAVGMLHAMGGLRDVQFVAIGIVAVILALGYYAEKICNAMQMPRVAHVTIEEQEESLEEVDRFLLH